MQAIEHEASDILGKELCYACILLFPLILVDITELTAQQIPNEPTINGFTTYENSNLGVKMQYPANWTISREYNGPTAYDDIGLKLVMFEVHGDYSSTPWGELPPSIADPYHASFVIELLDVKDFLDKRLAWGDNFTIMSSVVGGIPGIKVEHNLTGLSGPEFEGGSMVTSRSMDIFVVKLDKLYSISYYAPSDSYSLYMPLIQEMVDSVIFL